jgi:hypothetical protein
MWSPIGRIRLLRLWRNTRVAQDARRDFAMRNGGWASPKHSIKQSCAWARLLALFAIALLIVVGLATRLLLRRDTQASALLRRVASRRHGRCELRLVSAMVALLQQEPGLYDHLVPRLKLK